MTLKIFVWVDANCNGENIEWVELDVKGFLDFISNPQNKGRRIIKLCDPYFNEADTIYIEVTEEQYIEWKKEYDHALYVNRENRNFKTVSMQELQEDNSDFDIAYVDEEIERLFKLDEQDLLDIIESIDDEVIRAILCVRLEAYVTGEPVTSLFEKFYITKFKYYRNLDRALKMLKEKIYI